MNARANASPSIRTATICIKFYQIEKMMPWYRIKAHSNFSYFEHVQDFAQRHCPG
jgi:hypothetical protein